MRTIMTALVVLTLVSSLFAETRVSYIAGSVSVFHNNAWGPADTKTALNENDRVKTAGQSRAVLTVNDITHIWVGQNSEMAVARLGNESFFSLLAGKIRAKVKLLSGQKFRVKTPVAVASVRGTEFILSFENQLIVLEGKVEFSDLNLQKFVEVAKGQIGEFSAQGTPQNPRKMNSSEHKQLLQEWQGFGAEHSNAGSSPRAESTPAKEELRKEMHNVASQIRSDVQAARQIANDIKESDISAGRTLRDVHGNLVRVEQHLLRPDSQTIELLNLTKRSDYTYSDRQKWGFATPSGSRLDVLDINITMNLSLPNQLTDWPSFISSHGDDIHPNTVDVKMTNQADVIEFAGKWMQKGSPDPHNAGKNLQDDQVVFNSSINGWNVDPNYDPQKDPQAIFKNGQDADGHANDQLWAWGISPQIKVTKNGSVDYVRLYTEVYGINNAGAVLSLNNFTSSSENPFTLLKQVAGEQITFARRLDGTSFFTRGNLDLVATPDLAVAVAEKLSSQVGDISKNNSNNNNSTTNNGVHH